MARPVRLVTYVELEHADGPRVDFSARHDAVLADERRVTLLADRGWGGVRSDGLPHDLDHEDIERTARMVVGPDEAYGGRSQADMAEDHWAHLAGVLRVHGVAIEADELARLPHEVVLGERLLAVLETVRRPRR